MGNTYCGPNGSLHSNKGSKRNNIVVNEIYGPVKQGEGKSAGRNVMFLRTAGCNLRCNFCDSAFTWNWKGTKFQHPDKFDPKLEMHPMTNEEILTKLRELGPAIRSIVISGGEPMLQQESLIELMRTLKQDNYLIEVETNGTRAPLKEFSELVDQINCSPKLSNSGPDNPKQLRIRNEALVALAENPKTNFKFVISDDKDIPEILDLVNTYKMKEVYLMPEGRTREEQLARQDQVERLCKQYGFNFSPRLQVLEFGDKRGV